MGKVEWLLLPTVNIELFELALEHFAKATGACNTKHILLVLDKAGWHYSSKLKVPEGVHLFFQPSHTPEVQPAEHLWPWIREAVANDWIDTLDHLESLIIERCRYLDAHSEVIQSSTNFHWWKDMEEHTV